MRIPFCGPTYQGRSLNVDPTRSVNFYLEPTSQTSKAESILVGTPGTSLFSYFFNRSSPVRALHTFNNKMYAVIDDKFYELDTAGVYTLRGTLATSSGRVQMDNNGVLQSGVGGDQLIIIDGTNGYIYDVITTTFSTIASSGGWADLKSSSHYPQQVAYLDGYFIVINGSMSYWVSNLYDGTTYNALATSPVSASPDNIVSVIAHHEQLFFLKTYTTEVWYNTGTATSTGSPFSRVSGAVFDYGCAAPWSVAKGAGSIFFLATQKQNNGGEIVGIAQVTEYQPTIISTPSLNWKIWNTLHPENCFGYCYSEQGHNFYVFTYPGDDASATNSYTLVYDTSTQMWHERSSYTSDFTSTLRHLSNCYTYFNNKHYVGDYQTATILEMGSSYTTDNGINIPSFRVAPIIYDQNELDNVFVSMIQVDAETGVGTNTVSITPAAIYPAGWTGSTNVIIKASGTITAGAYYTGVIDPQASLSWSNDSGHTWSDEYTTSMGQQNQYSTRMRWRRLGKARNKVFKFGIKDAVKKVVIAAHVEAST